MSPSEIPTLKIFLSKQYRICDIQSICLASNAQHVFRFLGGDFAARPYLGLPCWERNPLFCPLRNKVLATPLLLRHKSSRAARENFVDEKAPLLCRMSRFLVHRWLLVLLEECCCWLPIGKRMLYKAHNYLRLRYAVSRFRAKRCKSVSSWSIASSLSDPWPMGHAR